MKRYFAFFVFLFFTLSGVKTEEPDVFDALSSLDRVISSTTEEFTSQDEYYIGRAVAAHILGQYAPYTKDPAMINYLNLILGALTINSRYPYWFNGYHLMILDSDIPNAYSTPGGHIFISRGLIDLVNSEDMLAAVIAHEIAHIHLFHGIAEIKHERMIADLYRQQEKIGLMTEKELAAERQSTFSDSISKMVNTLFVKGHSQLQEFEADSMAINLLVSAGYQPMGLIEMLKVLDKYQLFNDGGLQKSHPLPAKRIFDADQIASRFRVPNTDIYRKNRFTRIMGNRP